MKRWAVLSAFLLSSTAFSEIINTPAIVPLDAVSPHQSASDGLNISTPLEQFVEFVVLEDWQRARILADELLNLNEGVPRFDLYYGILLIHEQAYSLAIFPLERVLLTVPTQHRARLELGRAYFLLSNHERAKAELQQVMAANPPPAVQAKIKTMLTAIEHIQAEQILIDKVGMSLLVGQDSNANDGAELTETLDANRLDLTELSDDDKPIATSYGQWSISYALIKPTSRYGSRSLLVDYTQKLYNEPSLPTTNTFTFGGLILEQEAPIRTTFPVTAQLIASEQQFTTLNFDTSYQLEVLTWGPLWAGVKIGMQPSISFIESTDNYVKDMAGVTLNASERGRVHTFTGQYLQVSLSGQDDEHNEWRAMANTYSLDWLAQPNMSISSEFQHQWRVYKADDPLFTVNEGSTEKKRRQDHVITLKSRFNWQANKWLKSQTSASFESVNSNINAYGRHRFNLSQAFNIQF